MFSVWEFGVNKDWRLELRAASVKTIRFQLNPHAREWEIHVSTSNWDLHCMVAQGRW